MLIRLASPADAPVVAAIYEPIVRDTSISFEIEPPDAGEIARRISEDMPAYPWFVAADDDAVVGYAYATRHRARPAYRWAVDVSVYVESTQHRRGVGRQLYDTLMEVLTSQGYRNAFAGIALPNPASVGLHESVGFEYVGTFASVGWKHRRWHDVAWWQRSLGTGDGPPGEIRSVDDLDIGAVTQDFGLGPGDGEIRPLS